MSPNNSNQKNLAFLKDERVSIFLETWSNSTRTVQVRGFTEEASFDLTQTTSSDRSVRTSDVFLTVLPISLEVRTTNTPVRRGELFARVTLRVGGKDVELLSSGYLSDGVSLRSPNGKLEGFTEGPGLIRTFIGTNPAVATQISETVPTNARWKLKAIAANFVADANAADRFPNLTLTDAVPLEMWSSKIGFAITANLSVRVQWIAGHPTTDTALTPTLPIETGIPMDIILRAGSTITIPVVSIQAGDDFSAPLVSIEEWLQE